MRRYLMLLPLLVSGCIPVLIAGGAETGVTLSENRPVKQKVDDNVLYTNITKQFIDADDAKLIRDVTFNIRYGRVMLTGTIASETDAQKAVALTWKAKGAEEVINELIVTTDSGFFNTANDALIKRNLEARLLITKGVWVINYSMDVQNGTAYLIGRVKDKAELNRVLNIARTTKGVKKVVSHLQIGDQLPASGRSTTNEAAPVDSVSVAPAPPPSTGALPNPTPSQNSTVPAPDSISSSDIPAKH